MPRPLVILIAIVVVLVAAVAILASLDTEVPVTHVERPVANAVGAQP